VADEHVAHRTPSRAVDRLELGPDDRFVRVDVVATKFVPGSLRVGVGERPEAHIGAVGPRQLDRPELCADASHHVYARPAGKSAEVLEPGGAVVVAGDHHHRNAQLHRQGGHGVVEQVDGVGRRHGAVENVARDEHRIDLALVGQLHEPLQREALVFGQMDAVEQPAEVPVCGMDEAHRYCSKRQTIWPVGSIRAHTTCGRSVSKAYAPVLPM
jgi:hypothetical protein